MLQHVRGDVGNWRGVTLDESHDDSQRLASDIASSRDEGKFGLALYEAVTRQNALRAVYNLLRPAQKCVTMAIFFLLRRLHPKDAAIMHGLQTKTENALMTTALSTCLHSNGQSWNPIFGCYLLS